VRAVDKLSLPDLHKRLPTISQRLALINNRVLLNIHSAVFGMTNHPLSSAAMKIRMLETVSGHTIPAAALTAYARVEDRTPLAAGFKMLVVFGYSNTTSARLP